MTTPNNQPDTQPTHTDNDEPIIPPQLLLALGAAGLLIALIEFLADFELGVVGIGVGIMGIILLFFWGLMNPDNARATFTGRNFSYSVTGAITVIVVMVVAGIAYSVIEAQNWQVELSGRNQVTLNKTNAQIIRTLGNDPTIEGVRILAFYETGAAGAREQVEILLNDLVSTSNGKISYEFIDPNRQPNLAQTYGIQQSGQLVIVPQNAEGDLLRDQADTVSTPDQRTLVTRILAATATGDFRAYFAVTENSVTLDDPTGIGAQRFATTLRETYNWTVEEVDLLRLAGDNPPVDLDDPAADGIVLVIPGGTQALSDEVLPVITDHLNNGGKLLLLGAINTEGELPLAAADNLSSYLTENFGMQMRNDYVFDPEFGTPLGTAFVNYGDHPITQGFTQDDLTLMDLPHSIDIAESPPESVTITPLLQTSENAYAKTNLDFSQQLTQDDVAQEADDLAGVLTVGAVAENTQSGAQLALYGGESIIYDAITSNVNAANGDLLRQTLFWMTNYNDIVGEVAGVSPAQNPQDAALFLTNTQAQFIRFISLFALPFGVLGIGIFVWYMRREQHG